MIMNKNLKTAAWVGAGYFAWVNGGRKLFDIFLFVFVMPMIIIISYEAITGQKLVKTEADIILEKKQQSQRSIQYITSELKLKMKTGDLNAQTDLAQIYYLGDDDPSNDELAWSMTLEAANKDCAKAQWYLGWLYNKKGNKDKARKYWVLAAKGREERTYGTGSYRARGSLRYYFPEECDPKWHSRNDN